MNRKIAASLLATTAVAVVVIQIADDMPSSVLRLEVPRPDQRLVEIDSSKAPVVPEAITRDAGKTSDAPGGAATPEHRPFSVDNIPSGYRATTIKIGSTTAVEGWARSSNEVAIQWMGNDPKTGGTKVTELMPRAKVLSADGDSITVLLPAKEAAKVNMAAASGSLIVNPAPAGRVPETDSVDGLGQNPSFKSSGAVASRVPAPPESVRPDMQLPPLRSAERYIGYADAAPIAVSQEAVSTFSIDVDTASYTNVRRFLQRGQFPPRAAVRTEEFINYFDYGYPVQQERPFTLSYELAPSPITSGRTLLKLGIKARDMIAERKPWNLVFLIDTSGSMSDENKLPLVKKALRVLVERMRPEDRVAIVTYAGSSEVKLSPTSGAQKAMISGVIEGLSPGGGIYGSRGIQTAYSLATANRAPGVNREVLVTDRDFNVGVTSHDDLIRMIE